MSDSLQFTPAEAAFVLRESIALVKKEFDAGPVQPRLVRKGGSSVRTIGWFDLIYLYASRVLRDELTPKGRREFYEALKRDRRTEPQEIRFGRISVSIGDLEAEVEERARELAQLAEKVDFRADGEPLFRGTSIEIHRIESLLAGGMSVNEILQDYPSLDTAAVSFASTYAEAYPKAGRPYPRTTVKRALRGAGFETLDGVLGSGTNE